MWFKDICIVLTRKCNANCDICCFECSNSIQEKLDVTKTIEIITLLKEKENVRTVSVTGGEPFLYYNDLLYLLCESKKMGLGVTFTTNGFWGKDYQQAYKKLETIKGAGIAFFTLSIDDYHQKYIPYEPIRNIIGISKKLGLRVIVNAIATKKNKRLKGMLEDLEDTLLNCTLIEIPCVPAGRAAMKIPEDEFIYQNEPPAGACELMNIFTIFPDGNVYPCCSEVGMSPFLHLGNIYRDTVDTLLDKFYSNTIYYQLAHNGPKYLYETCLDETDKKSMRSRFVNTCDMCRLLFEDVARKEKIISKVGQKK